MTINRSTRSLTGALALASGFVLATVSCDRPASGPGTTARGAPTGVYTVRARVEMVPIPGRPTTDFVVFHEPIDTFVNPDKSRGMNSMSMPMPLAKGVSIEGIKVGDLVQIELAVWTTPGNLGLEARSVTKLSADTPLHFGKAAPPLGEEPKSK